MANESFDVNWTDVDLMNQRTNMSCWAASAAMVVGWRDRVCIDPAAIAAGTGDWAAYANGLQPADIPTLANVWGLTAEAPQCYTIDGLRDLLQAKGPLWVAAAVPTLHAIVVTGMYSDGTGHLCADPRSLGSQSGYPGCARRLSQLARSRQPVRAEPPAIYAGVRNTRHLSQCHCPNPPSRGPVVTAACGRKLGPMRWCNRVEADTMLSKDRAVV